MENRRFSAKKILDEARVVRDESQAGHENGTYKAVERRIFQPVIVADYTAEAGTQTNGDISMSYSKAELSQEDVVLLLDLGFTASFNEGRVENWIAIEQLEFIIEGIRLNIFDFLPPGFKIIFCPTGESKDGFVNYEKKIILFSADVATMGSIAVLLHEAGHVNDNALLERLNQKTLIEDFSWPEGIEAEKLRKEREASLFALRKMWPLLRRDPLLKSDIILFLRNIAYYSYCEISLDKIAEVKTITAAPITNDDQSVVRQKTQHDVVSPENRLYDVWVKFKKSTDYIEWKKLPEFISLEESQEYDAWLGWVASIGKIGDQEFYAKYAAIDEGSDPSWEAEPAAVDISEQISEILATANMPERLRLTKELEWQIADRSDVVATLDWTNLNHAKWVRSFVQRVDVSGLWNIAIRATEAQMKEDPNVFTGVIHWTQVSE